MTPRDELLAKMNEASDYTLSLLSMGLALDVVLAEGDKGWWCAHRRGFDNCVAHPDRRVLFPARVLVGYEACSWRVVLPARWEPRVVCLSCGQRYMTSEACGPGHALVRQVVADALSEGGSE